MKELPTRQREKKNRKYKSSWYARRILPMVWSHPNNEGQRAKATVRSLGWHLFKRTARRPLTLSFDDGISLKAYPDSGVASNLIYFGLQFDAAEMGFLKRYLREGDGFIDGGANIGAYSLLAAKIVGPSGRVDAFEPDLVAAARLRENATLNGFDQIHLHQAALSEREGRQPFTTGWDVSNRLVGNDGAKGKTIEVATVTLDRHLENGTRYAAAKLDLEGGEGPALKGALSRLEAKNPPVWMLECVDHFLRRYSVTKDELVSIFKDAGYLLATINPVTKSLEFDEAGAMAALNLVAVAREQKEAVLERISPRQFRTIPVQLRHYRRSPRVLQRRVGGELLLAVPGREIDRLSGTALSIWENLEEFTNTAGLTAGLAKTYEVAPEDVAEDVEVFVNELCERNLVEVVKGE